MSQIHHHGTITQNLFNVHDCILTGRLIPLSIEDTKPQDQSAPSAGITCSINELINHASEFDLASISQCL